MAMLQGHAAFESCGSPVAATFEKLKRTFGCDGGYKFIFLKRPSGIARITAMMTRQMPGT